MVAEEKQGGKSSPAFFKKLTVVCSGAALAVTTCLSTYDPIPVYADAGNFVGAVDYILSSTADSAGFILTPGGGYVAGAIIGIYLCTQNPMFAGQSDLDASSITCISGYYYLGTELHTCYSACSSLDMSFSDGRVPVCVGTDFTATAVCSSTITHCIVDASSTSIWYRFTPYSLGDCWLNLDSGVFASGDNQGYYYYGAHAFVPKYTLDSAPVYTYGDDISGRFIHNGYAIAKLAGSNLLPSGTLDLSNPMLYIDSVLRPYVEINYPDYVYLLPEPEPEPPQYDTDVVTGIPKEWTITNPQLPTSPHFELTVPDGDFDDIDPGDTFTGFSSGVGFWWAMVNQILTTFHIKALALALLAVAVAIFALYKIGG